MLYVNQNPSGKFWNCVIGAAELADGIVRVVTLGILCTKLPLVASRKQADAMFRNVKKARLAKEKA